MPGQSPALRAALEELGVRPDTLTTSERAALDRDGYLVLPGVLSAELVARMRARLTALEAQEGALAGMDHMTEPGSSRLGNLPNKDPLFDICFTHPRLLAAVAHIIDGDFRLAATTMRAALPGHGFQALHADWDRGDRTPPSCSYVANSIWALDDFTAENGATRVVPGSHRWREVPQRTLPYGRHPQELALTGAAGTVIITNAYLWHGGGANATAAPRRALHSFFKHRAEDRSSHQLWLSAQARARLGRGALAVLDADYVPSAPYWIALERQAAQRRSPASASATPSMPALPRAQADAVA